jgi:hypothetical protein
VQVGYDEEEREDRRARGTLAALLIVVGTLVMPLAIAGWFVRSEMVDSDRFVETVAPLARDTAVQEALIDRVTEEIVVLAERVQPGALTPAQVDSVARSFVATPQFAQLWDSVLREAHPQLRQVLLGGDNELVTTAGGRVVLDLGELARQVQARLQETGFTLATSLDLTQASWQLTLVESDQLERVQTVTDLVQRWAPWALVVAIGAFVVAVIIGPRRDRVLRWIGVGLLVGAGALLLGLVIARSQYIAALDGLIAEDAAEATFDVLTGPLHDQIQVWALIAVMVGLVGIAFSPRLLGAKLRR